MVQKSCENIMEFKIITVMVFLISPIYWGLYKLHGRLTKVETILNGKEKT